MGGGNFELTSSSKSLAAFFLLGQDRCRLLNTNDGLDLLGGLLLLLRLGRIESRWLWNEPYRGASLDRKRHRHLLGNRRINSARILILRQEGIMIARLLLFVIGRHLHEILYYMYCIEQENNDWYLSNLSNSTNFFFIISARSYLSLKSLSLSLPSD